jgi:hypothetical protein
MTKGKGTRVPDVIRALAADAAWVTTGDIARAAGITRQAAHYHVRRMTESGHLERQGAGRGARYRLTSDIARTYPLEGQEEHRLWAEISDATPELATLRPNVQRIVTHSFNEMMNNAIEHSEGSVVEVRGWVTGPVVAFELADDGIGVFRGIRDRMGLPDEWAALQELVKGKATTAPAGHSGEGIFFTSKAVDLFELEDPSMKWLVDNPRDDQAVGESVRDQGTRVRFDISKDSDRSLAELYDHFAPIEDLEFTISRVPVELFQLGVAFVSRSEARRVAARLERFRRVELDFAHVEQIGQAFADELFRVWASRHPDVELVPIKMAPVIERVVLRAIHAREREAT